MRNTPVLVLLNIWRQGQVKNAKLGMNVSDGMLLNAVKFQGTAFTFAVLFRENQRGIKTIPSHPCLD